MKEGMDEKKVSDWHLTEGENGAKGRVTRPSLEEYLRIGIRIKKRSLGRTFFQSDRR
ncbi:hypothetical protein ACE3MS_25645 [Paenibacillus dendritiformis]|uniref:hypothetical protein n=1 Tax=Paenibacillus dendritiformis TaxID=130049 RepID=UPI00365347CD